MKQNTGIKSDVAGAKSRIVEDELVSLEDVIGIARRAAARTLRRSLSQAAELMREKKWDAIVGLFHPLEEKMPELVETDTDGPLREKVAFALGQMKRFDEAIKQLEICLCKGEAKFSIHSSLAYTAYNSLYAARNREIMLSAKQRKERIGMARRHFEMACRLRPDSVTNYYRHGMLCLQLEGKPRKALPLFAKAIANWEQLEPEQRQQRHQEARNYIKALYNGAKAAMEQDRCDLALELIRKCLAADEATNYLERQNKYFALGKINFQLNRYEAARDALKFARRCNDGHPADHVTELLARTYLAMGEAQKALREIEQVPRKRKRPYIAWTEADILLQLGQVERARAVLQAAREKDGRSRHKTCVKLAGIAYLSGDFTAAMELGGEADDFFRRKWINHYPEGLFWKALGALRAGHLDTARGVLEQMRRHCPDHPRLAKLENAIRRAGEDAKTGCQQKRSQAALRSVG